MIYTHIKHILQALQIPYEEITHEVSTSCEHSKELRTKGGMKWAGSKNIIFHAKGKFYLVTTLWDKEIKARNFKHEFGTKDIRFATQEEITKQIWSTIGSIPPFGFENNEIPIFVDSEIFSSEFFCFNPWIADKSIQISTSDLRGIYSLLDNPRKIFDFTEGKQDFISL